MNINDTVYDANGNGHTILTKGKKYYTVDGFLGDRFTLDDDEGTLKLVYVNPTYLYDLSTYKKLTTRRELTIRFNALRQALPYSIDTQYKTNLLKEGLQDLLTILKGNELL